MASTAHDLARQLADHAEAVCRHYLSNGRRHGGYWMVGNIRNAAGRSMFVRLHDGPKGPAGKWTDAATGEHGDLLDILRSSCGIGAFADVLAEARRFLALPETERRGAANLPSARKSGRRSSDSVRAALRLLAMTRPGKGTLVDTYLQSRSIDPSSAGGTLRFHPRCYYRPEIGPTEQWPAMLAPVTDNRGRITGVHRTWLARDGSGKAQLATPRRAMGDLLGHGVRFGAASDILIVGEGIETMLSLRRILPEMPVVAALSAAHVAGFIPPTGLRTVYVACDRDPAGQLASQRLIERAMAAGIRAMLLSPVQRDFNDDLHVIGPCAMRVALRDQMAAADAGRFLPEPA